MFNFNLDGKKEVVKPMRSYIDIDENGRPKARIYADEYDSVKSNPDFEPYLAGAGRNMQTSQDDFADEMNKARLDDVESRIKRKRVETLKSEEEARKYSGTSNEYPGIDILGRAIGSKTFGQVATSRQQELRKMMEERAGYMGTPEISAPMDSAGSEPVPAPAVATEKQEPKKTNVRIRNPDGKILAVPAEMWNKNSKGYIEQGYQVVP